MQFIIYYNYRGNYRAHVKSNSTRVSDAFSIFIVMRSLANFLRQHAKYNEEYILVAILGARSLLFLTVVRSI